MNKTLLFIFLISIIYCNDNPKISIIIPVYNTKKYLRKCLDSVINQTLKEIEIICINDAFNRFIKTNFRRIFLKR